MSLPKWCRLKSIRVRIYEGKDKDGKTKQVKLTTQKSGRIRLDVLNDDGTTALIGDFPPESTDVDVMSSIMDVEQDLKIIKPQDAIQESSTETVDVQEPARDREAVGERDATGPVTTERIRPKSKLRRRRLR